MDGDPVRLVAGAPIGFFAAGLLVVLVGTLLLFRTSKRITSDYLQMVSSSRKDESPGIRKRGHE